MCISCPADFVASRADAASPFSSLVEADHRILYSVIRSLGTRWTGASLKSLIFQFLFSKKRDDQFFFSHGLFNGKQQAKREAARGSGATRSCAGVMSDGRGSLPGGSARGMPTRRAARRVLASRLPPSHAHAQPVGGCCGGKYARQCGRVRGGRQAAAGAPDNAHVGCAKGEQV